jgi:hypothetical protein
VPVDYHKKKITQNLYFDNCVFIYHFSKNMPLNSNQISTILTVMWDGKYWMVLFEKRDSDGYSVAKATISVGEPQGYQVEEFLKTIKRHRLQFTTPGPEPTTTQTIVVEKKTKIREDSHS